MTFQIIWTERAKKDLRKLESRTAERIINKTNELSASENPFLEKIKDQPYYKFRIGNYRIILERILSRRILIVLRVGNRKNIYKKI